MDQNFIAQNMERKIAEINARVSKKNEEASQLLDYLHSQREKARISEEIEEEELKKKGIIIGQHIPSLKSKLELKSDVLSEYETFSSTILVAKDLVEQNKTNFLRRTGNKPISDLAESRKLQNEKRKSETVADIPNYQLLTSTAKVRDERILDRFAHTIESFDIEKTKRRELESSSTVIKKQPKKKKIVLSAPERIANEDVLRSINHKLNYLRNPRNDPSAVTKMLVISKEHFTNNVQSNQQLEVNKDNISIQSSLILDSKSSVDDADDNQSYKSKLSAKFKPTKIMNNPLFIAEPSIIYFTNYEMGKKYTQTIAFRNISAVTRSFRVINPSNPVFKISALKFPANCNGGMVAPGMSVTTILSFSPNTLGDYNDHLKVDTESGSIDVPIKARREPPNLSIPSVLDIGACLVGDAQRLSFACSNTGGNGRFKLLTFNELQLLDVSKDPTTGSVINDAHTSNVVLNVFATASKDEISCMRIPPFTLYPIEFALMKNQSFELTIEFIPLQLSSFKAHFYMLCDNGQVRQFFLKGESRDLNLSITEINSVEFDCMPLNEIYSELCFKASCVGSEQLQSFVAVNDTGIPVEYEWVWLDTSCVDLHKEGQNQIYEREIISLQQETFSLGEHANEGAIELENKDSKHKKELLKSLQMSVEGFGDRVNSADAIGNRAIGGRKDVFEISPARGVLPGEGAEKFEVRFNPADLSFSSMRAVMMIKSVPVVALTGPEQRMHLENLSNEGHGKFARCRSWIEDIGSVAQVEEYIKRNGSRSNEKVLINLKTVVQLVISQAMQEFQIEEYEFMRINKWVRQMMRHTEFIRQMDKLSNDDLSSAASQTSKRSHNTNASSVCLPSIDGITLWLQIYDWIADGEDNGILNFPMLLPPLKLSKIIESLEYGSDSNGENEVEEALPSLTEFTSTERALLGEIWVDNDYCVLLLGEAICAVLDSKINHEAVDYLKNCALNHMATLSIAVQGEGQYQRLQISPPCINVGGLLSIGKSWENSFTIDNPSSTTAEIELNTNALKIRTFSNPDNFEDALVHGNFTKEELVTFTSEYDRILLMPQSQVTVKFSLVIHNIGKYEITVPLISKSLFTTVDNLLITANVSCPKLRYDAAEVDIGLVAVGAEGSKVLSFMNEGDVPLMFIMKPQLHLDINVPNSTAPKVGSTSSRSRQSTQRSDDFSIAESGSEADSAINFKIELKNAMIIIDPPTGIVRPQEHFRVTITCKAGKIPQRIRGLIESRIYDEKGKVEVLSQYLNLRGEVQAPKTKMYPLMTNLGQVYVGIPVKFTVSIENMCNLPTMFKLMRPGGESSLYKIAYDKPKGPLAAKEKVDIECTFTAIATGLIDDIISNKIFGSQIPLAFVVKSISKGILLEFSPLTYDMPIPLPLADPTEAQFPGNDKPPEPKPIEPLVISDSVPLYERKSVRFVIRNFSAIPVPFQLRMKKFAVIEKPQPRFSASVTSKTSEAASISVVERDDLILAPRESGTEKFKSDAGKKYIGFTVQKKEDRKFLYSGLGASYFIDTMIGTVVPWGVQVITVHAFNDIPGCYDDEIECIITEGTITRSFYIPIKMSVIGCPIVIEKDTVGMTIMHHGESELIGKQMLHLGYACVNAQPLTREFYVKNHGSKNGKIKWQVKSINAKTNGPIKLSYQINEEGKFKTIYKFWEDIAKDSPFSIEPENIIIPPYEKKLFKVTLFRTNTFGSQLAELISSITFSDDVVDGDSMNGNDSILNGDLDMHSVQSNQLLASSQNNTGNAISLLGNNSNALKFTVSLLVQGDFLHPTIVLDKNNMIAPDPSSLVDDLCGVIMKAPATLLFADGIKTSDVCHKMITLTNPTDTKLLFNVSTEGPFSIKDEIKTNASLESLSRIGSASSIVSSTSSSVVSTKKSKIGKTFNLYPNESGSFHIAFNPRKDLREKLMTQFGQDVGLPTEQRGKLILSYSTGQSLHIPIITKISTPFLSASTPRMHFGVCLTTHQCEGILLLTNPTNVPAQWIVSHVPGEGSWRRSTAIRVTGFQQTTSEVDDPNVFEISPNYGVVDGPTVSVIAAVAAPPMDYNRKIDTIVPQRVVKSSWATKTLTLEDSLELKHHDQHGNEADVCYPMPLKIKFIPNKNCHYSSRFRFKCEFANSFDLVLQGIGTYEEHLHKPLNPTPK